MRQLRGEAHPAVQVKNCGLALAQATGRLLGSRRGSATLILQGIEEMNAQPVRFQWKNYEPRMV